MTELATKEFRDNIAIFEKGILSTPGALEGDELEKLCPVVHSFGDGCYIRQLFMPKGTLLSSKIHKTTHPYFVMTGKASVATKDGVEVIQAPFQGITQAGTKRAFCVHEDMVLITVHATNETDLDKIEEEIIAKDFNEYDSLVDSLKDSLKIEAKVTKDREDYIRVLAETGVSHQKIRAMSENTLDQIEMPLGFEFLSLGKSSIEGVGLFTSKPIKKGDRIGPARIDGMRTPLGRYVNHSFAPNAEFELLENGNLDTIALCDVMEESEILCNYRQGAKLQGIVFDEKEVIITEQKRSKL